MLKRLNMVMVHRQRSSSPGEPAPRPSTCDLLEIARHVYMYARRWAVGQSPNAEDALIYDACIAALAEVTPNDRPFGSAAFNATSERFRRYGRESVAQELSLPVDATDAVVFLHRFARRYTNGRGTFTAALVNSAAKQLLESGVSLTETEYLDGTIWAADGADGAFDTLTEPQRVEALASLSGPRQPQD